jgi:hypothetical protein
MPSIQIGFSCPPIIVALLFLASLAAAFFYYQRTVPLVPRSRRAALAVLRGLALFLLLVLLCNPVIHLIRSTSQQPVLAVLVDNSASMRLSDRSGDRADQLHRVLSHPVFSRIGAYAKLSYFQFGTTLTPLSPTAVDSLTLNAQGTDISSALRNIIEGERASNIQAALLVTDGVYTRGTNPLHVSEQLPFPLYTIGIGDSAEQKDVVITKLAANAAVYSGIRVPVDVTVKSAGYNNQSLEISLFEGTTLLDKKTVTVAGGSHEYSVQLFYTPEGEGLKQYTVRVSSLPDELTLRNNRKTFFVRVRKSKLFLLMIAGEPSSDVAVIRQSLMENPNHTVRSFTQRGPNTYYEGTFTASLFDSADCVVLVHMPTGSTSPDLMKQVQRVCVEGVKPLLFVSGRRIDYGRLASLSGVLPFVADIPSTAEYEVFPAPVLAEATHPLLTLNNAQPPPAWEKLPPVLRTRTVLRAKPEAHVLATVKTQNVALPDPLILTRSVQRRKVVALSCYGVWRWRLMAQGSPETESILSGFLSTAITWLTTPDETRPLIVRPVRDALGHGELVEFQGQAYDQTMRPIDNAQVAVRVRQDTAVVESILRSTGDGRYEGSIAGLSEGIHFYRATASINGTLLGADSGKFSVGSMEEEYLETPMNAQLLRAMADRTGGRMYTVAQIEGLEEDLRTRPEFTSRRLTTGSTIEARSWPYLAGCVILLLALEWFIRKRSGML